MMIGGRLVDSNWTVQVLFESPVEMDSQCLMALIHDLRQLAKVQESKSRKFVPYQNL